jgi:hypothetical protein
MVVAAVAVATIGAPVAYGGATATADAMQSDAKSYGTVSQAESELGVADEVYLRDDGSAVLRYDHEMDVDEIELGMDASEGLIHLLVVDDLENGTETGNVETGSFSAVLDQQGLSGNGSLVMQRPDQVSNLSVDVSGAVTAETNRFDATATGTFASDTVSTRAVTADGHVTATADRLETAGTVSVDGQMAAGAAGTSMDVSLEDTTDGYAVDVAQKRTVSDWRASGWETRDQAKKTLQDQYGTLSTELGGTSEIRISQYDFEERVTGQHRLELEYTIEYTGIDDGVEERLTDELATDPSMDLNRSEAESVATSVTDLKIETFEFSMSGSGGSMTVEWEIALANYDELTLAVLDLAESSATGDAVAQEDIDRARTAIDAQQATDLTWTTQWNVSVERTSSDALRLDAELTSDTENWAAYVDELEANDVETPNDVTFSMTAETDGDELAVDGRFDFEAEELADRAVDAMAQSAQSGSIAGSNAKRQQFASALAESELDVARVDASVTDGTVRVEGGAKVDNVSAVAESLSDTVAVSGIATETGDDTTSIYVYVADMGEVDTESATKSDLEHLGVVGSETTVHQAGEWDEEFPEVDTAGMRQYLDTEATNGSDTVPGFGPGIGIAAVAGLVTMLLRRQRA